MPTLRVDDVELFYEERGAGTPLVFLHGLGSSSRDWQLQLEHFCKQYRCLAFDLPGSGRSVDLKAPRGPFSIASFASTLARALTTLRTGPVHLVGLSMGGMTGLQLALDAPQVVRSLTVVNATGSVVAKRWREGLLLAVRAAVTKTLGPWGVSRLVAPRLFPKPEHAALRATFIAQMAALDARTYAAVSAAVLGWSVEERVQAITCPVLFVCADADYTPVAAKEALARRMPRAQVLVVADAHHALPVEKPNEFNALLDAQLASFLLGAAAQGQ
jgi:pimeloyl-ACP methyl ester carboxylesterase